MPLRDHFAPPLETTRSWRSFHSAWATNMAQQLNRGVLPPHYYAEPNTQFGAVEIDVATLRNGTADGAEGSPPVWTPPGPALVATINLAALDVVEVRVMYSGDEQELMAAVEIVSPSNKDRPSSRRAFAIKCADILNRGASLVIVDAVTSRRADLHAALLDLVESDGGEWQSPTRLSAIAYRAGTGGERRPLEVWPFPLTVGEGLPTVPLWLGDAGPVPLDLDASYTTTCELLRLSPSPTG